MEPIEPGCWREPNWMGTEPRLMLLLIAPLIFALVTHVIWFIVVALCVVLLAWRLVVRLSEVDEQAFAIQLETIPFFFLTSLERLSERSEREILPGRNIT